MPTHASEAHGPQVQAPTDTHTNTRQITHTRQNSHTQDKTHTYTLSEYKAIKQKSQKQEPKEHASRTPPHRMSRLHKSPTPYAKPHKTAIK